MKNQRCRKSAETHSSPLISVVIVTYKSGDYIAACIQSVEEAARDIPYEVIVVDNAPEEGLPDLVRREFPLVLCLENDRNEGFARAVNRGANRAKGKYIVILNPDTLLHRDGLRALIAFMDGQTAPCVVGPRTVDGAGHVAFSCHSLPHLGNIVRYVVAPFLRGKALKNPRKYLLDLWKPDRTIDLALYNGYLQGSCLVMKLEFFRSLGMLDERYFLYAEDADLGFKIRKAGFSSFLVNEAEVIHVGKHVASKESRTTRYFVETYVQYIDKNLGKVHGLFLKTALLLLVLKWLLVAWFGGDRERLRALRESLPSFLPHPG